MYHSDQIPSVVRYHQALLLLFFFFHRQHAGFWNFNSNVPVKVVGVKSCVIFLFHPACVEMRIAINKTLLRSRAGGVWCCGRALRRRGSAFWRVGLIPVMFPDSIMYEKNQTTKNKKQTNRKHLPGVTSRNISISL